MRELICECPKRNPLRGMDALHIGCVLVVKPDFFVSSDRRQIEAALREKDSKLWRSETTPVLLFSVSLTVVVDKKSGEAAEKR